MRVLVCGASGACHFPPASGLTVTLRQDATDCFGIFHPPTAYTALEPFCIGEVADAPPERAIVTDYRALRAEVQRLGLLKPRCVGARVPQPRPQPTVAPARV
jgi:hypothetical protein